jgi:hypothetical protein
MAVIYECLYFAVVYDPDKPFHPNLMSSVRLEPTQVTQVSDTPL